MKETANLMLKSYACKIWDAYANLTSNVLYLSEFTVFSYNATATNNSPQHQAA